MTAYLIGTKGPGKGLIFACKEQKKTWILGNDANVADFVIEDPDILPKQASVTWKETGLFLDNHNEHTPCLLNNEPIQGSIPLEESDSIVIGNSTFTFSEKLAQDPNDAAFDAIFEENEQAKELPSIDVEDASAEQVDTIDPTASSEEEEEEKTAYDTIFEEGEEVEDIPFNLLHDAPLILKVIAGPNAGAEIGLEKNRSYIIGKDPANADIVFQDLSVSRRHAKIDVDQNHAITIEDLESKNKTLINGIAIEAASSVSSQDIVSTGTTTFLIIDREADLQTIYAPESTSIESTPEEPEPVEEKPAAKDSWKEEVIPTRYLFFVGSFAFIVLIMFISIFSVFKAKIPDHLPRKTQQQQLQEVFASYHDITFHYSPHSAKVFVVGHVLSPIRKETLLHQIRTLGFVKAIEENIVVDEYVVQSMNQVLVENIGLKGINIHSPKAGMFIATGYLESQKQLAELTDYLQSRFPYADRLENHVVVESNLLDEIQNIILATGFSGLKIQITNGMLVLGGLYDEKESKKYQQLLGNLQKIHGVRGLKNLAVAASENAARIDISKKYQVSGFAQYDHFNYSVVINGQIFRRGELLSGMMITKILPNSVLLERNGLKYKIEYSR